MQKLSTPNNRSPHSKSLAIFTFVLMVFFLRSQGMAQSRPDTLFFKDRLQPLSKENVFKTEGYYNWGGSIIKDKKGTYHLFYSRWKKEYTFTGWLTHSEIAHATSKSPAGPWKYKNTALTGRGGNYWDAITAHNPKIKYFEGKYYLYYISTHLGEQSYTEADLVETAQTGYTHPNWKVLRPNQRTGVAVSNTLNGPWTRMDKPIVEPSGPITTLTVNPAIDKGKDGKYYLIVKGDKPNETRFIRNQAIAVADTPSGPFTIQPKPVIDYLDTEDMSLWYDAKRNYFYGVFHAHSIIGMVSSQDGIHWKKATEYAVLPKKLQMPDGQELIPDRMERPFIYVEDNEPRVLSLAVKKGDESYLVFNPIESRGDFPLPNKRQLAWQQAEMGAVFHYDLHVFDGVKYGQGNNRIDPVDDYQIFNPQQLDTDQWIKAAKDAGFTFAILTATHETGFALFQSDVNPYSMKALNFQDGKGDIVRDFVNSCRKYGIKPGIYVGIRWNSMLGVHNFKVNGEGEFKENRQKWYNRMVEGMVKELCTNYGELFEIWFDGGADSPENGAPDVLPIVQQYQPNCLFYHNKQLAEARWGGSESGTVSYPNWSTFPYYSTGAGESAHKNIAHNNFQLLKEGDPNGNYWVPAMADAPLRGYNGRHEWFWEPGDEAHIFPLKNLMDIYYKSVGRNSTLIMGLTPDPRGLLPEPDVQRLKEWGDEIKRRFSNPLGTTSGKGSKLQLKFDQPTKINHVILQEDISKGERVRAYRIEGWTQGGWKTLTQGKSIGHKRIEHFTPTEVSRIRLVLTIFERTPQIVNFSAFFSPMDNTNQ
ncbi:alpha-L-fucosidase [Flagellimonas myxillae]|uniref:alpha-L-fucosidase n=1 Tax=Flagellimonas myxillae TaxID=2942214 RepID=UPI00201EE20A|nr:alpha-L-fucosidase [Muricauda myxillae]MCL6267102.1 alpha-L-fucosidase [Muricauda myxillae]